jgi:CheY-like chemotaxis protein
MDVQMPVMDGMTATQMIRALPGPVRHIPIIALTANVLTAQIERFRAAGMNDHVGKPFRPAELLAAVQRWSPDLVLDGFEKRAAG